MILFLYEKKLIFSVPEPLLVFAPFVQTEISFAILVYEMKIFFLFSFLLFFVLLFQEDYHVADLRKELSSIRRLLKDERKKSTEESHKLDDSQLLFAQVYSEYQNLRDQLKQEKKHQVNTAL